MPTKPRRPAPLTLKALDAKIAEEQRVTDTLRLTLGAHDELIGRLEQRCDETERLRAKSHANNTPWGRLRWLLTGR